MANVHCIQQTLQGHHPTNRPCNFVRRYDGVSQRRPTFDTTFFLVVGIIVLTITERVRLGTDIFHVATTWITVYFSLTMSTNVLLSGKYFLVSGFSQAGLTRDQVRSQCGFSLLETLRKGQVRGRTG